MRHEPVLLNEVLDALDLKPGKNIIDCTLGDAGHSEKILEKTAPTGMLLGIDMDPEAILRAKQFLYRFDGRARCVRENFAELKTIIEQEKITPVDGILMDFGWSTPQFEDRFRGFSFMNADEPLDMRFGAGLQKTETAADILNTRDVKELERIFHTYGEESLSRDIAVAVVEKRKEKMFEKVQDFVGTVLEAYRKKLKTDKEIPWIGGLHPATKVFQALRIAVNDELGVIERTLPQAVEALAPGGRLAVITFHSLEDRIVKHYFKKLEVQHFVQSITKKPIVCSLEEASANPRARSAKLRVVQKI